MPRTAETDSGISVFPGWPDHLLTLADWDQLPEQLSRRSELVEGVLLVVPKPAPMHQRAVAKLCAELQRQLPASLTAVIDVDVVLSETDQVTVRAPDLIVVSNQRAEANPARFVAAEVDVAVEIVSPGSGRTDRVTKMAEYAEAGIGHYWILELGPPVSLATYVLTDSGVYVEGVSGTGAVDLRLPVPLQLDLDGLTRR